MLLWPCETAESTRKMNSDPSDSLPITEQDNTRSANLSSLSVAGIVSLMNAEDAQVAAAVTEVLPQVVKAIDGVVERLRDEGRLFYIGTGTSGRLGVLDAAECPPTFGVSPQLIQAIIAGGYEACYRAVEASEDDPESAKRDLLDRGFQKNDALIGIAASGRTPYTVGAVAYARSLGAFTAAITCVPDSPITQAAEVSIVPIVGPEVLTGSTRLKAGTAQKMVLNMISTASLVQLGFVSGNRMSNIRASNSKLRQRAIRVIMAETALSEAGASMALDAAGGDTKLALVMVRTDSDETVAREALSTSKGVVQEAITLILNG
jgi:N-acetylmuramic acid 6-phosphate etherase